jgi:hypothetical protein
MLTSKKDKNKPFICGTMKMKLEHFNDDIFFEIFVDEDFKGILLFKDGLIELFGNFYQT